VTQAEQSKAFIEKARELGALRRQGRRRGHAAAGPSRSGALKSSVRAKFLNRSVPSSLLLLAWRINSARHGATATAVAVSALRRVTVAFNPFRPNSVVAPGMFLGRVMRFETVGKCLFQAKNGNPVHFLIQGERGIGKSSLCMLIDEHAPRCRHIRRTGTC